MTVMHKVNYYPNNIFSKNSSSNNLKSGSFKRMIPNNSLRAWLIFFAGIVFGLVFFYSVYRRFATVKSSSSGFTGNIYNFGNCRTSNLEVIVEEVKAGITNGFLQKNYL
jgi:predicted permease